MGEIKDCIESMTSDSKKDKKAWSDIVKENPDRWVMFTDVENVEDERVFLCTVLKICTDEERTSVKASLYDEGYKFLALRTTDNHWGGCRV